MKNEEKSFGFIIFCSSAHTTADSKNIKTLHNDFIVSKDPRNKLYTHSLYAVYCVCVVYQSKIHMLSASRLVHYGFSLFSFVRLAHALRLNLSLFFFRRFCILCAYDIHPSFPNDSLSTSYHVSYVLLLLFSTLDVRLIYLYITLSFELNFIRAKFYGKNEQFFRWYKIDTHKFQISILEKKFVVVNKKLDFFF